MQLQKFSNKKILSTDPTIILITEINFCPIEKKVVTFCLLLLLKEQNFNEIIKYDATHKECHVHKYFENLNCKGQKTFVNEINAKSYELLKQVF
jgi:hypothetical protein